VAMTGLQNGDQTATVCAGKPRAVIVCAVGAYREALATCMNRDSRVPVVAAVEGLQHALEIIGRTSAELVLVDVSQSDDRHLIFGIARECPATAIIALGISETESDVVECAEAGAAAYVSRRGSLEQVIETSIRAATGQAVCSPAVTGALLRRIRALATARAIGDLRAQLTAREVQVLELIDRGLSNKEIAQSLCIETATVKNHVHNILSKLDLRRRSQAIAWLRAQRA
jgi:two-component system, NarL family, nitrate/nitrite response regulator NarL